MEIHPSVPMSAQYGGNGRAALPIESFIDSSSYKRCNHLKHLGVPIVVALMYIPNQTSRIPPISEFEHKMSSEMPNMISNPETAPYGEIHGQERLEYPLEETCSQTMQHIPDDVYDKLLNNVLYSHINENSPNDNASDSSESAPKKRSRKKR